VRGAAADVEGAMTDNARVMMVVEMTALIFDTTGSFDDLVVLIRK